LQNNVFVDCRKYGLSLSLENDYLFIDNNLMIGVNERKDIATGYWA